MLIGNTGAAERLRMFSDRLPEQVDVVTLQEVFCGKPRLPFCTVDVFPQLRRVMKGVGLAHHTPVGPAPSAPPGSSVMFPLKVLSDTIRLAHKHWWGVPVLMAALVVPVILVGCLLWLLWSGPENLMSGGLMTFCRWPILQSHSQPWKSTRGVLFPEYLSAKGFQWVRFLKEGTYPVNVINVHICAACSPTVAFRQLRELDHFILEHVHPQEPLLVQGDFNLIPSQLKGRLTGLRLAQQEMLCTWRHHNLKGCRHYDHFLYRRGHVARYSLMAQGEYLSDHVPIVLWLALDNDKRSDGSDEESLFTIAPAGDDPWDSKSFV